MSAPSFSVVLDGGLTEHPIGTIFYTALLSGIDLGVNLGISAILEAVFPQYSAERNVWLGGLEAMAEVATHVVLSGLFLQFGRRLFSTRGTLVPYGALVGVFLLRNAIRKLYALQEQILSRSVRQLSADKGSDEKAPPANAPDTTTSG